MGQATAVKDTIRCKGSKDIMALESDTPLSIFIDGAFFSNTTHQVPILASNFALYEKFFVHNVELEFVPNQPVTVGGTISIAPDYDPLDPMPVDASALSASKNYIAKPVTQGCRCKMPNLKGPDGEYYRPSLYTGPASDDRLVSYGQFHVFGAGTGLATGTKIGRLILHFDISFFIMEPKISDSYNPSGINGIALAYDQSGTVTAHNAYTSGAGNNKDAITFQTDGVDTAFTANNVVTAIIGAMSEGLMVHTPLGKRIYPGSRIFLKPADTLIDIAGGFIIPSKSNSYVGNANLSRGFGPGTALSFLRTAASTIELLDSMHFY